MLILGCGHIGKRVARHYLEQGERVLAIVRSLESASALERDGNPSTMTDYFFRVAAHAGLPRPPTTSLNEAEGRLSPGMMSYMRESRRLSNRKLREELGVALQYPTLEAGLRDCPGTLAGE